MKLIKFAYFPIWLIELNGVFCVPTFFLRLWSCQKIKSIFLCFRIHNNKKKHSLNQSCPNLAKNAPPICLRDPSSLQKVSMTFPAQASSFTQFLTASVSFVPSCESVFIFIVRCYVMCHESLSFHVEPIKRALTVAMQKERSGRLWFNSFVSILTFQLYQLNESIKTVFDGLAPIAATLDRWKWNVLWYFHVSDEQRHRHSNNVLIVRMSELRSVFLDFHRGSAHTMCCLNKSYHAESPQ